MSYGGHILSGDIQRAAELFLQRFSQHQHEENDYLPVYFRELLNQQQGEPTKFMPPEAGSAILDSEYDRTFFFFASNCSSKLNCLVQPGVVTTFPISLPWTELLVNGQNSKLRIAICTKNQIFFYHQMYPKEVKAKLRSLRYMLRDPVLRETKMAA